MTDETEQDDVVEQDDVTEYELVVRKESARIKGQEWFLTEMSSNECDRYKTELAGRQRFSASGAPAGLDHKNLQASLIRRCLRDKDGRLVFTSKEEDKLGSWPASVQQKLFLRCLKLNGIGVSAEDEDADAKNS